MLLRCGGGRLGAWIDAHDVVVRFNERHSQAMLKTTNPYPEARTKPLLDGDTCRAVLVISPQTRRGSSVDLDRWIGPRKALFTYAPDPGSLNEPWVGGLTTGVAVFALLRRILNPASMSLTGFTMFLDDTAHSYWTNDTPAGVAKHDMRSNAKTLIELINLSTPHSITITSELVWLPRKVGMFLSRKVSIKSLLDDRWNI